MNVTLSPKAGSVVPHAQRIIWGFNILPMGTIEAHGGICLTCPVAFTPPASSENRSSIFYVYFTLNPYVNTKHNAVTVIAPVCL